MKRILFIVLAIVIAVSCFAVPAFADDTVVDGPVLKAPVGPAFVDSFVYSHITTRVFTDGEFVNYYLSNSPFDGYVAFYTEGNRTHTFNYNENYTLYFPGAGYDSAGNRVYDSSLMYSVFERPWGLAQGYDIPYKVMEVNDLPVGATIYVEPYIDTYGLNFPLGVSVSVKYYDLYGSNVHAQTSSFLWSPTDPENKASRIVLDYPSTAVYLELTWEYDYHYDLPLTQSSVSIKFPSPSIAVGIPINYFEDNILGEINGGVGQVILGMDTVIDKIVEMHGGVEGAIADLGDKIDNLVSGELKPITPGGSGNLGADTDSIINNAHGGIDYAGGLLDNIGGALAQAATGFAALTAVFNLFSVMPFFSLLLQLSVTIGLFGLMTGLLGSIVSKFSVRGKGD